MSMLPPTDLDRITITREDALDTHVDDLLKRQASMRGEGGITRAKRVWFLQNWFIFGVVGLLAALAAWGILTPYYDDTIYIQGTIDAIQTPEAYVDTMILALGSSIPEDRREEVRQILQYKIRADFQGEIDIDGEQILVPVQCTLPGTKTPFDLKTMKVGDQLGVYLKCDKPKDKFSTPLASNSGLFCVALFATPQLRQLPPSRANRKLIDLYNKNDVAENLLFPLVAALIGLAIGAIDGIICRLPRRAILGGLVGFLAGFIGGFAMYHIANLAYTPLAQIAQAKGSGTGVGGLSGFGLFIQITGRSIGWALAGTAMGLGQGISLRSGRLLLYGLLGGLIGGLLGGLAFDPLQLFIVGENSPSAAISRAVGLAVIGICVGAGIGIVELLARDAWLRMLKGPLAGKEFLLFKDMMRVGASPNADIYLFNDSQVADFHVLIRSTGNEFELESVEADNLAYVNNLPVKSTRLRHGDQVSIGQTQFVFERRRG